ncbi:MAG TPA: MBL fold metallo-hydrolase [Blastocatellia bacterium]|jgi:glyoxylase-like metal-dependent hydrolase (beta-lactamase superfamily II)|nr:MBL fold metallo-hydrolase [Blastocatellia bacterium]
MKFGSFDIETISDGTFALDGGAIFSVVPRVLWERHFAPDERNRIRLGLNSLLVSTPREKILIDTGIGRKWDERSRDRYGIADETDLLAELGKRGIAAEEIDYVINTHLHFDHAGTNTVERDGRPVPAFPRARYVVQKGELEHAFSPHERDRASYIPADFEPVVEAGQFDLIDGEAEIVPGVRVLKVAGHNRDLQCVRVDSEGETAFFFADLLPTTAHVQPAWVMSYDLYPVETLEQKKRLVPQAMAENWVCAFYHDPRVPLGRLRQDGSRIAVTPWDGKP